MNTCMMNEKYRGDALLQVPTPQITMFYYTHKYIENLVDSDDLLIEKEVVFKDSTVVMQMAIEPFIVLHNIPK